MTTSIQVCSIHFLAQCHKSTLIKWPFSVRGLVLLFIITELPDSGHRFRQNQTFVIMCDLMICLLIHKQVYVWENYHSSNGDAEAFMGFHLLSFACHCYSRGFPLWAAVLIADGVVLAKYLVTVLKGWKMWGWGGLKESPFVLFFLMPRECTMKVSRLYHSAVNQAPSLQRSHPLPQPAFFQCFSRVAEYPPSG